MALTPQKKTIASGLSEAEAIDRAKQGDAESLEGLYCLHDQQPEPAPSVAEGTNDRIFLVGFMGAGKTTVGRALAEKLHWQFIDLDEEIVRQEQRTIAEIFRLHGEVYFRRLESATLRLVLKTTPPPLVLAAGGGAYVHPGNAELLRRSGFLAVFLDASVEELRRRCAGGGAERPLARDENQFRQLYEARRSAYMAADVRVHTGGKTPEQVVEEVLGLRP
jgi:shikimate kinase